MRQPPRRQVRNSHGRVLHSPSHRRHCHRHRHRHRRRRLTAFAPGGTVSRHRAAADHRRRHLHRCRRAHDRAVGRDAAGAAVERRGRHALHAVHERQRRHRPGADHVRHRYRPQHRSGQRAEPARAGTAQPAVRGRAVRLHHAQVHRPADGARLVLLAEGQLRLALPGQLRQHQHRRRALSRVGRRRGSRVRQRRLRDADLGQARPPGDDGADDSGNRPRGAGAEHRQSRRPGRRPALAHRSGPDLYRQRARPAADARGVRQHHRAHQRRRLRRPSERCRACRARRAELSAERPGQRPARRRHRRLPGAGFERAGGGPGRPRA